MLTVMPISLKNEGSVGITTAAESDLLIIVISTKDAQSDAISKTVTAYIILYSLKDG